MKLKTEFQDEDFEKGEVADISIATMPDGRLFVRAKAKSGGEHTFYYDSLESLYNDWSDYKEPKGYWYIGDDGEVYGFSDYYAGSEIEEAHREIGNLFESKKEAEQAVEKLKAVKRLKDKGFGFFNNKIIGEYGNVSYTLTYPATNIEEKDLDLLFSGEGD